MRRFVITGINPEPWAIGPVVGYGRAGGRTVAPNPKVQTYQKAVREELEKQVGDDDFSPWEQDLYLFYVRSTAGGQPADVTNLNKSTEDALQGILFANDRHNRRVTGEILDQGPNIIYPGIIIVVQDYLPDFQVNEDLIESLVTTAPTAFEGSDYEIPEDPFE